MLGSTLPDLFFEQQAGPLYGSRSPLEKSKSSLEQFEIATFRDSVAE
jgi:hypothetical protein